MIGERMKLLREEKKITLKKLSNLTNKSISTLSRYERNLVSKYDPIIINEIANTLETSTSYLLGLTEEKEYPHDAIVTDRADEDNYQIILVTDDEMSPEIPKQSLVKIRPLKAEEKLQVGSFYYIKFNDKKCFRIVVDDHLNGISFMPISSSERRIACDTDYVDILGKAVSMKVVLEDSPLQ